MHLRCVRTRSLLLLVLVHLLLVVLDLPLVPVILVQAARVVRREGHAVVLTTEHSLKPTKHAQW